MSVQGFKLQIHNSLTSPLLVGGVPRLYGILVAIVTLELVLALHQIGFIPVGGALWIVGVALAKKDPYFPEVIQRSLRQSKYYAP